MQCLLNGLCFMFPKLFLLILGCLGFSFGVFSAIGPKKSVGFYQTIMERFNWKVAPIDEAREIRTTRMLGVILVVLNLAIFFVAFSDF